MNNDNDAVPPLRDQVAGIGRTDYPPTQAQIEAAAIAICKSRTCEGLNCCQWPANGGHRRDSRGQPIQCNVRLGAYDDAAKAAITAAAEMTPFAINRRLSDASLKALSLGIQAIMERMADLEALTETAEAEEQAKCPHCGKPL